MSIASAATAHADCTALRSVLANPFDTDRTFATEQTAPVPNGDHV
jgi:hypothetical protein